MKKIHLNFLSALPFLLILGIFLVSSRSSEDVRQELTIDKELTIEQGYLLPLEISDQEADFVNHHIKEVSSELKRTYINNYIVGQYLVHFDKANDAVNSLSKKDNLSQIDLSKILTSEELALIKANLINNSSQIQGEECVKIYKWSNCCWRDRNTGNCVAAWCGNGCWPSDCDCG